MSGEIALLAVSMLLVGFFGGVTAVFFRCMKSPTYFEKFKADIAELREGLIKGE